MDGILISTTTPGKSGPGSNGNEGGTMFPRAPELGPQYWMQFNGYVLCLENLDLIIYLLLVWLTRMYRLKHSLFCGLKVECGLFLMSPQPVFTFPARFFINVQQVSMTALFTRRNRGIQFCLVYTFLSNKNIVGIE